MTIKELKTMSAWGIKKWIDKRLPEHGDYRDPEIVSDHYDCGGGDYAVTFIFHNTSEENTSETKSK